MISKIESFSGCCDSCKETYMDDHSGFSIFANESTLIESMDSDGWYTGYGDPDYEGKHYCPDCFNIHPTIDDKIVLTNTQTP